MRFVAYSWTAASRRHGVSRERAAHVVEHCGLVVVRPSVPPERPDEALLFLGHDQEGAALEVVGVLLDDGRLRVIYAMEMQRRYLPLYEEVAKWRV